VPYLIGTDEAGYGPNLGPLTVTGTLWRVPNRQLDLFDSLSSAVSDKPLGRELESNPLIHVADSKSVYGSTKCIKSLERSVLAILHSLRGNVPAYERELLTATFSKCVEDRIALMAGENSLWLPREPFPLPIEFPADRIPSLAGNFSGTCSDADVQLIDVQCRPIFPAAFNRSVQTLGNKANVLSSQTMQVIAKLLSAAPDDDVTILCDKHGGRSKYLPLIQQHLWQQLITVEIEGRAISRYHWTQAGRRISIQFSARGESQLPVAFASMVSKYVREVFMHIWNEFWQEHIDDLKPTKGYPVDAKRFMADIESDRDSLGIPRNQIWRER
jgi:ribonuclease HII